MPGVPVPPDRVGMYRIGQAIQLIQSQCKQQQDTITDNKGRTVMAKGLIPGSSPPLYGTMFYEPATGAQLMFQGYDSGADTAYVAWYDGSGNEVVRLDATGFHMYNSSGTEEVTAGLVNSSPDIYGLAVLPYGGSALQLQAGSVRAAPPDVIGTVVGAWTAFSSPNSVTVVVGPSGQALVNVGAMIDSSTGIGYIAVGVDGNTPVEWMRVGANGGPIAVRAGQEAVYGSLSAGSHTFEIFYSTNGAAVDFTGTTLTVSAL